MADTNTTHYNLVQPENFGSQNTWGPKLNNDFSTLDSYLWAASQGTTIGVNAPASSGSDITLTNPINNSQQISFSATGKNLILSAMNVTASPVEGGTFTVTNVGSNAFGIKANDGTTVVVASILPGYSVAITLTDSGTANGSFSVTSLGPSAALLATNNLNDVANKQTSQNNLLPSQTGQAGAILTTDGTNVSWGTGVPTGVGMDYWGTTAPTGWVFAYGQVLLIASFPGLYAIFGTIYGGDGVTTFGVPDKRGRSSISKDDMGGTPANRITNGACGITGTTLGSAGGDQNLSAHTHSIPDPGHVHLPLAGHGGQFLAAPGSDTNSYLTSSGLNMGLGSTTGSATTGITGTNSTGSGTSANVPPGIVCNYIIKI